jgi:hypothetical protein
VFDIFTIIIFVALAVFIFLRLRSVLARRNGRERPPYEVTLPMPICVMFCRSPRREQRRLGRSSGGRALIVLPDGQGW